ncbi:MAG: hypothetical protein MUF87_17475 [Anaerolineae bacterium]|jgi:hypothetical protein|nr:hypothetical protein [Anaerolineae bacterium]
MSIKTNWENEDKTVILHIYEGEWSWEDYYQAQTVKTKEMMQSVSHTVHIFADFHTTNYIPRGVLISHVQNALKAYPPNWGFLIFVIKSGFLKSLGTKIIALLPTDYKKRVFFANTYKEAHLIIQQNADKIRS